MTNSSDPVVTKWWWVRHAPVTVNNGLIYGSDDLPCDVGDTASFDSLAKLLPKGAVLVTSALQRTQQTASAIAKAGLSMPEPQIEPALDEQSFGSWQGKSFSFVQKEYKSAQHDFWLCPGHMRPPEGESFLDLQARATPRIDEISHQWGARDIICVGHGGTIRVALALALRLDPDRALAFTIDNLSITRLDRVEYPDRVIWRVVMINRPPLKLLESELPHQLR